MKIVTKPSIYVVGRPSKDDLGIGTFLADHGLAWDPDPMLSDGQELVEMAGRVCYMSFGKGRKNNKEYLANILESRHGSVLEHAVWNFVFTGISRSLTHELVRHRAGWAYSQLSQRYVDESETAFVMPPAIHDGTQKMRDIWQVSMRRELEAYLMLVGELEASGLKRKQAREAARSVLPNATETKIFASANARAIRHFLEMRGSLHADAEIRNLALALLPIMQAEAPNIFGDYEVASDPQYIDTPNLKV